MITFINMNKLTHKQKLSLFASGFLQVFFVVINTYMVSNMIYAGVLMASFTISFIWSFNVKKIAFGKNADRIVYALGAAVGSVSGLLCSEFVIKVLNLIF